jgi:hypothetical protein
MKKHLTKKRALFTALVVVALAVTSSVAYAYFTGGGSGAGTATVGTTVNASISGTAASLLYPGGPGVTVPITVTNNSAGHQRIGTVTLTSVDAFTGPLFTNPIPTGTGVGKCDTTQFTMPAVTINEDLAAGATSTVHNGTLTMANDPANTQDGCKSAILRLNLTSN